MSLDQVHNPGRRFWSGSEIGTMVSLDFCDVDFAPTRFLNDVNPLLLNLGWDTLIKLTKKIRNRNFFVAWVGQRVGEADRRVFGKLLDPTSGNLDWLGLHDYSTCTLRFPL